LPERKTMNTVEALPKTTETLKTTVLCDEYPDARACELQFRIFGPRAFQGTIRTVRCLEDNALLRRVLSQPGQGNVMVVDGGGSLRTALMGDLMARLAMQNGWAGAVIYGAVRDVGALDNLDFAVKALGSIPKRSGKTGTGEVDVPVTFGGITFSPGHWLCSDENGVVVLAQAPPT